MAAFRVYMYHPTPAAEAIVATLRFGGIEVAEEERPSAHEVILRYSARDSGTTCALLVALLDRLHPLWRNLISLSPIERTAMTQFMTEQGIVRVPAGTWDVDPAHSSATFEVKHMMIATVRGHFREFGGRLDAHEQDPANSRLTGWAKVASIDTGNAERDVHLRSAEFFDADRWPEIRFASTRIQHVEGGDYRVSGDLTIKDVTREVELTATVEGTAEDPWGNERVGISVRGTIDRTHFGVTWQQRLQGGGLLVGEKVSILLNVSAVRAA